jgi:hypothetical protein
LDRVSLLVVLWERSGLAFYRSKERREQFRISMQTPVENPLMTIESFNRQFQAGEKEREAVKWGWEQKTGNSMLTALIPTALHPKTASFLTLYVVLKFS